VTSGFGDTRLFLFVTGDAGLPFVDRGWRGVAGAENERRRGPRADLTASPSWVGVRTGDDGVGGGGFAASPRALMRVLTMCVASDALSRGDSSFVSVVIDFFAVVLSRGFEAEALEVLAVDTPSMGSSRLLRRAVVAGVHVETDKTALRTASV